MNAFLKSFSDYVSLNPTKFIVLMNIGFTGSQGSVDQVGLTEFLKSLKYKKSLMPPCPYCFIEFHDLKESQIAVSFIKKSNFFQKEIYTRFLIEIPLIYTKNVLCDQAEIQTINGLHYFPDFISEEEERVLLDRIKEIDSWDQLSRRLVKHFGYSYDYVSEGSRKVQDFPDWLTLVLIRIQDKFPQYSHVNQATINCYEPGDGIGPHSDSTVTFGLDPIIVVSLSSPIVMDFIKDKTKLCIDVGQRSLLVLSDESRLSWQHGIRNRKIDYVNGLLRTRGTRISLTFRKVYNFSLN